MRSPTSAAKTWTTSASFAALKSKITSLVRAFVGVAAGRVSGRVGINCIGDCFTIKDDV